MVLLVAQQDVVQQRAVAWQEGTGDVQGEGMPQLALLVFLFNREILEFANFIFQLDNESDFC